MDKQIVLVSSLAHTAGRSIILPVVGKQEFSKENTLKVSVKEAELLVEMVDWLAVEGEAEEEEIKPQTEENEQLEKGKDDDKEDLPTDPEGEDLPQGEVDNSALFELIENSTLKELQEIAREGDLPGKDWRSLRKKELQKYLKKELTK